MKILTYQDENKIRKNDWIKVVDLLCDIADGKTTSFGRDSLSIEKIFTPNTKTKYHFKQFLFDKDCYKQYQTEFLMLDFILFFQSNKHSHMILNPKSNYSFNKMQKLLNMLENHRKGNKKYFQSFSAQLIDRCLHLQQQYVHKSDIFHKIFGLLVSFIKKHNCTVGKKAPMLLTKIYECIVANHYYNNLDEKKINKYYDNYVSWMNHQSLHQGHRSSIDIKDIKMETLCHDTVFARFSYLCERAALHAKRWKNLTICNTNCNSTDFSCKSGIDHEYNYSKKRFLIQTQAWIEQACDFGAYYWNTLVQDRLPRKYQHSAALLKVRDNSIFNYKFFRTFLEIMFFDIIESNSVDHNSKYNNNNNNNDHCQKGLQNDGNERRHIHKETRLKNLQMKIWKLGYQYFDDKSMIKFKNYTQYWFRFFIDKDKQLQLNLDQLRKNKMFMDLLQVFSGRGSDVNYLIKSIRFPYGTFVNFYTPKKVGHKWNMVSDKSFPTPEMIELMVIDTDMNHNHQSNNSIDGITNKKMITMFNDNDCFKSTSPKQLRKTWHSWGQQQKYSPRLTYAICNVWEDIVYQNECKYYSCYHGYIRNDVFIKYNIPNEIIYLILDYRNSIVMIDNINETNILIDTYGKSFDYYPKILNWSVNERRAHTDFMLSMNLSKDIVQSWLDYFAKKKRFGFVYDSIISKNKVNKQVNNIVSDIVHVSDNHSYCESLFGNITIKDSSL